MNDKILTMEQAKRRQKFKRAASHPTVKIAALAALLYTFAAVSESDYNENIENDNQPQQYDHSPAV